MATVIKKISELENLEELTSASNVIIEENGKAKRFSAANLGKVKTVNGVEPDENGNIEIAVGSGSSTGSSAQPDYNQNDPTAADYIKNRPFYMGDLVETELLDVNAIISETGYDWELSEQIDENTALWYYELYFMPELEVDKEYTVLIDGTRYSTIGVDLSFIMGGMPAVGLGETDIMISGDDAYPNKYLAYGISMEQLFAVFYNGATAPTEFKIFATEQELVKLDPKYLPEGGVGYVESTYTPETFDILQIMNNLGVEFEELTGEDSTNGKLKYEMAFGYMEPLISFIPDSEYTVTVNGVSYTGLAADFSDMAGYPSVTIGDLDAMMSDDFSNVRYFMAVEQPEEGVYEYYLMLDAEAFGLTEAPTEFTISGSAVTEIIHKIDSKYLPEQVKSDWNENDPNAECYIANRPFYEAYIAEDVLLEERTFEDISFVEFSEQIDLVEGEVYIVTFDGKQYNCVAWSDDYSYLGGKNEPFLLYCKEKTTCLSVSVSGTHTIKIESAVLEVAKKIDKKFLPDDIGGSSEQVQSDWNQNDETAPDYIKNRPFSSETFEEEVVVVPEQTFNTNGTSGHFTLSDSKPLTDGKTYTVVFNGQQYECVAYTNNNNVVKVDGSQEVDGRTVTFEVQSYDDGGVVFFSNYVNEYTIKVTCIEYWETIEKINPKYLPNLFSGSWNDLRDKPFDDDVVLYEQTVDSDYIYNGSAHYHKLNNLSSSTDLNQEFFIGKAGIWIDDDDIVYGKVITEDSINVESDNAYSIQIQEASDYPAIIVVKSGTYTYSRMTFSEGVWGRIIPGDKMQVIIPAKQINEKCISVDWNSNSDFDGGYIKNRTHYINSTNAFWWDGEIDNLTPWQDMYYRVDNSSNKLSTLTNDKLKEATITIYVNDADGERYETMKVSDWVDNGYIFEKDYAILSYVLIVRKDNLVFDLGGGVQLQLPEAGVYFARAEDDEMLFYIAELSYPEEIKTLPDIYISDNIARKDDFYNYKKGNLICNVTGTTVQISESNTMGNSGFSDNFTSTLIVGNWYVVEFNGIEYVCRYSRSPYNNRFCYLGNMYMEYYNNWINSGGNDEEEVIGRLKIYGIQDSGEPFSISGLNKPTRLYTKSAGAYTIKVYEADVNNIDEQYIPDTFVHVNDLYDRGITAPAQGYVWNKNTVYNEVLTLQDLSDSSGIVSIVKIGDNVPESDYFIGMYMYMTGFINGNFQSEIDVIDSSHIESHEGYYTVYNAICVVTDESIELHGATVTSGVWFTTAFNEVNGFDLRGMRVVNKKTISDSVIPDSIARLNDIVPTPLTAQVGQTIVVKAVDENGKPTEWEAVDIPDANAPKNEFILNSSTEGSAKKFKITVDDNGKLTATEIVESEA